MPYAQKRRLEQEKELENEASKCKKIKSFFTRSSHEARNEACKKKDPPNTAHYWKKLETLLPEVLLPHQTRLF